MRPRALVQNQHTRELISRWRLRSLFLYLCYMFRALIDSLVCWKRRQASYAKRELNIFRTKRTTKADNVSIGLQTSPPATLFSDPSILCLPSVCTCSLRQWSFTYSAPPVWNSLSSKVRSSNTHIFQILLCNLTSSSYHIDSLSLWGWPVFSAPGKTRNFELSSRLAFFVDYNNKNGNL